MSNRFESRAQYLEWCSGQCQRLHTARIAMNPTLIREILNQIDNALHVSEGDELYDDNPED